MVEDLSVLATFPVIRANQTSGLIGHRAILNSQGFLSRLSFDIEGVSARAAFFRLAVPAPKLALLSKSTSKSGSSAATLSPARLTGRNR